MRSQAAIDCTCLVRSGLHLIDPIVSIEPGLIAAASACSRRGRGLRRAMVEHGGLAHPKVLCWQVLVCNSPRSCLALCEAKASDMSWKLSDSYPACQGPRFCVISVCANEPTKHRKPPGSRIIVRGFIGSRFSIKREFINDILINCLWLPTISRTITRLPGGFRCFVGSFAHTLITQKRGPWYAG